MIEIDIPAPKRCLICPMSYYILTGVYEGRMMCQAMETKGIKLSDCLIDEHALERPDNCPIKG